MFFLNRPFLPSAPVSHVLIAENAAEKLVQPLEKLNITAVTAPWSPSLPLPVRFHPDMNCRHLGGNRFAVFADAENTGPLLSLGAEIIYIDPPKKPEYPWDAALNVLPLGNILLLNPKSASSRVADQFSQLERVEVKQGYCACSVSVLTEDRIITGDAGIAKALKGRGVSVISADNSKLFLDGYGCGFIGGCSGLIGNRRICFTGDVSEALDLGRLIQSGFEVVFLTKEKPFDCGGIVPVAAVSE